MACVGEARTPIFFSGAPTCSPGVSMGTTIRLKPCEPPPGSVRHRVTTIDATLTLVIQALLPRMTHSPPTRSARVCAAARSEPAPGSVSARAARPDSAGRQAREPAPLLRLVTEQDQRTAPQSIVGCDAEGGSAAAPNPTLRRPAPLPACRARRPRSAPGRACPAARAGAILRTASALNSARSSNSAACGCSSAAQKACTDGAPLAMLGRQLEVHDVSSHGRARTAGGPHGQTRSVVGIEGLAKRTNRRVPRLAQRRYAPQLHAAETAAETHERRMPAARVHPRSGLGG